MNNNKLTFIDLFAGAGGMSEGFIQAGFSPIAHVEMNEFAAQTLETRAAYHYLEASDELGFYYDYLKGKINRKELISKLPKSVTQTVVHETMSDETLPGIFRTIDGVMKLRGIRNVDVVIGGPPCQAYSLVGRAQSSHMKSPMSEDPRNDLYLLYAQFLKHYQPKMFVFENVTGIESAKGGDTWDKVQKCLRKVGYKMECNVQCSRDYGVLQNRKRMIIVGWLKNTKLHYPECRKIQTDAYVKDLFTDLPELLPGQNSTQYKCNPTGYVSEYGIRHADDVLTLHQARNNVQRDIDIYKVAIALWNCEHKRLNYNDLPEELKTHKNRNSFIDRFKVVEGDERACHTILSHLSKDGHYFIHPDFNQHRSITVREAARIQSFPDSFFFEGPRTAQFVQVGNAVPPLMAKAIALGISEQLSEDDAND